MAQQSKLTRGGQITVPAHVRRRWNTREVAIEDHDDHIVVRPVPEDRAARVRALRGIWRFDDDERDWTKVFEEYREEERELEARKERRLLGLDEDGA
jgi:AbrB family looped-hinge helix DNA binding protein